MAIELGDRDLRTSERIHGKPPAVTTQPFDLSSLLRGASQCPNFLVGQQHYAVVPAASELNSGQEPTSMQPHGM